MKTSPFLGRGYISKDAKSKIYAACGNAREAIRSNQYRDCLDVSRGEMPDILVQEYNEYSSSLKPDSIGSAPAGSGINIVKKFRPDAPPHASDKFLEIYGMVMDEVSKGYIGVSKVQVIVFRNSFSFGFILNPSKRKHLFFALSQVGRRQPKTLDNFPI